MDAEQSALPDGDPLGLFAAWFAEARAASRTTQRDGARHRHARRRALGADGAAQGVTAPTASCSTPTRTAARAGRSPPIRRPRCCFTGSALRRQVRIEGPLSEVAAGAGRRLFPPAARVRQPGRLGGVATSRARWTARATYLARFEAADGRAASRRRSPAPAALDRLPLAPERIEFWLDRPHRLHDRRRFTRAADGGWTSTLLYP